MKIKTIKLDSGETVTLDDTKPLGKGGEGTVYRITSPSKYAKTHCVKIYKNEKKANMMENKITFLCKNIPQTPSYVKLCWPEQKVFHNRKFKGYLMPLAFDQSRNLLEIKPLNFEVRPQLPQIFKDTYKRGSVEGILARMKLSVHMAAAYHSIHLTGKYIIVDMKPDNILFDHDGKVSIVDCDSFQVSSKGRVLYEADVHTPEYTPPEFYMKNTSRKKDVSWDYFSFAVIVYELMYGVHPFAATFRAPYDKEQDIMSKIKSGLFVHGRKRRYIQSLQKDHPHLKFSHLPNELRKLWTDTFDEGLHSTHKRTSLENFGTKLTKVIVDAESKKKISSYFKLKTNRVKKKNIFDLVFEKLDSLKVVSKYLPKNMNFSGKYEYLYNLYFTTGILSTLMVLAISIAESNGFFGFIWGLISGIFIGLISGIFWPILLFYNWVMLLPLLLSILLLRFSKFRLYGMSSIQ